MVPQYLGTMVAAAKAGIPIFVTGGIGGVHYGAEKSECQGKSQIFQLVHSI